MPVKLIEAQGRCDLEMKIVQRHKCNNQVKKANNILNSSMLHKVFNIRLFYHLQCHMILQK